jgi:hypothetical protein
MSLNWEKRKVSLVHLDFIDPVADSEHFQRKVEKR